MKFRGAFSRYHLLFFSGSSRANSNTIEQKNYDKLEDQISRHAVDLHHHGLGYIDSALLGQQTAPISNRLCSGSKNSIAGTVTDATGALLPFATVHVACGTLIEETKTNERGAYHLSLCLQARLRSKSARTAMSRKKEAFRSPANRSRKLPRLRSLSLQQKAASP